MNKTFISITLMAALTFAIVGVGITKAEAYTADDISAAVSGAYNVAKNARISSFAMETCTNQINAGDYSNIDACMGIVKTFDKYMSLAVSEANSDIRTITGYGTGY